MFASSGNLKTTAAAAAMVAAESLAAQAEEFVLSSGSQGGSWYPLAGAIKAISEQMDPDLSITVTPGAGVANVVGVASGKFPVAFANTISTVDALAGRAPFREKAENVCNLGTLYPQWFQIVARDDANVTSIADFRGKRLTTQQNGNTGEFLTRSLLSAVGLSYDDMADVSHVSYSDSVNQMKDGHADIFTLGTALPAGAVMDVATSRDIEMVPITDEIFAHFKAQNAAFIRRTIPVGSYPNLSREADAITYGTHMIAACDYSGDVVKTILTAIADNLESLSAVNKSMATLTLEDMSADIGVPLHPAAAAFYRERGVN
ncbi:MAG: TAXI family TRAP transporter solute-binding subunit [Boseongicola sp. SB0662_bin_57]|nr:TAXI family TRAP transporter solute-binding subunit [Boseongicola sp. SB0662_bin_57]